MAPKLSILIVDDEPLARRRLRRLLAAESNVEVTAECSSGREAAEILAAEHPNLLLLDVQMPQEDGFSFLRSLPDEIRPPVIFVTAFDHYAVEAFQVHALDYVLKPVEADRLHEAIVRACDRTASPASRDLDRRLRELLEEIPPRDRYLERILVRNPGRISFVNAGEVHWIGAEGNYVRLHLANERHLIRQKIGTLEEQLDPRRFLRIHRSAIVNLDRVKELHRLPGGDYAVLLDSGARLTMSRSYRERFDRALGAHQEEG
jgi:two-component system LytT family response regulator